MPAPSALAMKTVPRASSSAAVISITPSSFMRVSVMFVPEASKMWKSSSRVIVIVCATFSKSQSVPSCKFAASPITVNVKAPLSDASTMLNAVSAAKATDGSFMSVASIAELGAVPIRPIVPESSSIVKPPPEPKTSISAPTSPAIAASSAAVKAPLA